MSICNADHCPRRAIRRGLCDEHARQQGHAKSRRRGFNAHRAGYDARWERTRRAYLRRHLLCERCTTAPSVDVHHIDRRGPAGPRGHDETNLEALCHPCHAAQTRADQLAAHPTQG